MGNPFTCSKVGILTSDVNAKIIAVYRHRNVMNIVEKKPDLAIGAWVAPSAAVIGQVSMGPNSSVWYNSVVKGAK